MCLNILILSFPIFCLCLIFLITVLFCFSSTFQFMTSRKLCLCILNGNQNILGVLFRILAVSLTFSCELDRSFYHEEYCIKRSFVFLLVCLTLKKLTKNILSKGNFPVNLGPKRALDCPVRALFLGEFYSSLNKFTTYSFEKYFKMSYVIPPKILNPMV